MKRQQPQPKELSTAERLATTGRAVAQGIKHRLQGRAAPYAEKLLFHVPQGGTEDLDVSMVSGAMTHQLAGKVKDVVTGRREEATDRRTREGERPR